MTEEWVPKEGWNAAFSEKDRAYCTTLFNFLKKQMSEIAANRAAHMIVFKQKYHGLHYSEEQEAFLLKCMKQMHEANAKQMQRITRSVKA